MTLRTLARDRLTAGLFLAGAGVGLVGNALHPHAAAADVASVVEAIARNAPWVAIHLAIVVAILLLIGGMVGLVALYRSAPGRRYSELGLATALVGGAVVVTSLAIDGFAMKAIAVSWAAGPDAGSAQALGLAATVRAISFGIWSAGMFDFFGVGFICFGAAIVAGGPLPRWLGSVALAGGAGSITASIIQLAAGGEVQVAETLFLVSSMLLTMWAFALGFLTWRGLPVAELPRADPSAGRRTDEGSTAHPLSRSSR